MKNLKGTENLTGSKPVLGNLWEWKSCFQVRAVVPITDLTEDKVNPQLALTRKRKTNTGPSPSEEPTMGRMCGLNIWSIQQGLQIAAAHLIGSAGPREAFTYEKARHEQEYPQAKDEYRKRTRRSNRYLSLSKCGPEDIFHEKNQEYNGTNIECQGAKDKVGELEGHLWYLLHHRLLQNDLPLKLALGSAMSPRRPSETVELVYINSVCVPSSVPNAEIRRLAEMTPQPHLERDARTNLAGTGAMSALMDTYLVPKAEPNTAVLSDLAVNTHVDRFWLTTTKVCALTVNVSDPYEAFMPALMEVSGMPSLRRFIMVVGPTDDYQIPLNPEPIPIPDYIRNLENRVIPFLEENVNIRHFYLTIPSPVSSVTLSSHVLSS